ncbi:ARF guanine-nucleotide exchange factor GNOM-like [Nicotiana sylvestris]|uniref:ARF guanine-nucleotide exchange factor GNOM-like n=1 Tax=Nicotiana sylvestris TaxID=4096 RepID=A0A1U7XQY4_NICSY|nr:PREDICTED: ARF guanine-nucleotide exchange factor GNOM-like [Nicotiana sylvestris]XP_009789339.1 PREDICTED: ARF guanine-nucleotide exchange factor GNOM-like [Nicotiana sylvestris]
MMGCLNQQNEVHSPFSEPKDCTKLVPLKGALACMVNSEIGAVLAVMRRNVRWGFRYADDDDQLEHPLIHSFKELRKHIFSWIHHWNSVDPLIYLQPFLDVIQSDETGAPITGVALSSVYKFLTLEIIDSAILNVDKALHQIVDTVTSCRFEVTDPASEEVVLMKILQVLLACMKSKASANLSNHHVCNIVNTCFRLVHQATAKSELLQRIARHTMHELVRHIFSHLPNIDSRGHEFDQQSRLCADTEAGEKQHENGCVSAESTGKSVSAAVPSNASSVSKRDETADEKAQKEEIACNRENSMMDPHGIPCMVEIFHFLCSLLNVMESIEIGSRSNPIAYDEDVPLFALGLINSAIEVSGASLGNHPELLALIQKELFHNLMRFGLSMSPLILSTVCSIVLNLYHHMRTKLKLQLEALFSGVLLRIAQSKHGASYQQQEVAMETLVDFCRQLMFMPEMYANFDCDISCSNVFEDLTNLLSKSSFPVNTPLSALNMLALDGLVAMIQGMAERISQDSLVSEQASVDLGEYRPFWTEICKDYSDPNHWVPFVRKMKLIKRKLLIGVDHLNRDPKKGMEFLQGVHLLPEKLTPKSVACFFRYMNGIDKNLIGDFLGSHEDFYIQVLHEFAGTFDFRDMNLDIALRIFLETFRLPGESQKIQRVLEAFAERYYELSPNILANKDAALLLSYSLIMLNTDQHNTQVKKKMTEEDFIRNNRRINGGNDLPREFLSELYHSICEDEIRIIPDRNAGTPMMAPSHWIGLVHKSRQTSPYIVCDPGPYLDYDIFAMLSGPTIASISVIFDNVEQEDVWKTCINGYLAIAKIAAAYSFDDVLNDLVVSLCKFTTLLLPSYVDEFIVAFAEDGKARLATLAVFTIANKYGDHIRSGWKNILDCILSLHKFGLLPTRLFNDAAGDLEPPADADPRKPAALSPSPSHVPSLAPSRKSSGLMGVFSQLLYLDAEEPAPQPTEKQLAERQQTLQTIQSCQIDSIFAESKFLQAESLLQLVRALVLAAGQPRKGTNSLEDEETAVFCLELLIAITINNRDRIMLLWRVVYDHIASVVHLTTMPCTLVEKAVFGLLRICQRLLPYKENLTDELLKSLQLILKLDARVAEAFLEQITQEVMHLVKANAMQIRSHTGWRTIISLLSFTARHPEASETGFETLSFIMHDGAHLLPANYILCLNVAAQFADSRIRNVDQSVRSLNLMAGSLVSLIRWSHKAKEALGEEAAIKMTQDIMEMWLRLIQGLRKFCLDRREEVRDHAILMLQGCLTGVDGILVPKELWLQCFDEVIFTLLDELLNLAQKSSVKDYRSTEEAIVLALKLMFKVFLQSLQHLFQLTSFCKLWLGVLGLTERCMKVKFKGKRSEKIPELITELLKNTLLVMKTSGILVPSDPSGGDSFWKLTWLHVHNICPSLQSEVFPTNELEQLEKQHVQAGCSPLAEGNVLVSP